MPAIKANGIDIFYDEFGDKAAPPILLIMGLGTQMIAWKESFCQRLAGHGFRVIRFDNRDIGLSTKFEGAKKVNLPLLFIKATLRLPIRPPYTLDDMAADAIGLLDALKIQKAHIVGASMGGMIAQIIAARYPQRCLSLTSMMSTSGARGLPGPTKEVGARLMAKRPPDREGFIQFGVDTLKAIGSPGYPTPDAQLREQVTRAYERAFYPVGFVRQLAAIVAYGSRVPLLKTIRVPTLVLHGEPDPLVPVEGGRDTAANISGAVLETIPGWGHDFPDALVPMMADRIAAHAQAAQK